MVRSRLARACGLAVACLAATSLAACGSDDASSGSTTADGRPTGTIRVATLALGAPGDRNPLTVLARDFERANPGVTVKTTQYDFDQYDPVIRAQINGGSPPDVLQSVLGYGAATGAQTLARAGVLADLSDQPWAAGVPEQAKELSSYEGRVYAYPPMYGLVGGFYNMDVLREVGVEIPRSFPELLRFCASVKAAGKTPIALGAQTPIMNIFLAWPMASSTAFVENPDFAQQRLDGEVDFAGSRGWRTALEQIQQLQDEGCYGDAPTGTPLNVAEQDTANGRAAMIVETIEAFPQLKSLNPRTTWAFAPVPGGATAADTRVPAAPSAGFAVARRSDNQELAKRFVDFVAEPENSIKYARGVGSVPIEGIESAKTAQFPPGTEEMKPFFADQRIVPYVSSYWPNPALMTTLQKGISEMLIGNSSPEDVLKSMDDNWDAG